MSIRLKLILTYMILVIISAGFLLLSSVAVFAGFFNKAANAIFKDTNIDRVVYETVDLLADLKQVQEYSPEKLTDADFIKELNKKIDFFRGGLVVKSNDKYINYSDLPHEDWFYDSLIKTDLNTGNSESDKHMISHIEDKYIYFDYTFIDQGKEIIYFFVADVSEFKTAGDKAGRGFFIIIFIILLIIVTPLLIILSRDIIAPIRRLEEGVQNIKDGNLDFELVTKKRNEIGKVILSFEKMRMELKKSIDKQVLYEENRRELISSISHDLKTPITSIKGYVEGIMDGVANSPDKMEKYLKVIYQKSVDMDRLIDDLFLFSKLDLNKVPLEREEIMVVPFILQIIEELKMECDSSNFLITVHKNQLMEETTLLIDQQKMKRVFLNIIQNSMKYMDKEDKKIDININNSGKFVQFVIADNGRGIKDENLPFVFEKFYREDQSRNTNTGGTGLGLAIAKQIVEMHEGKIFATSKVGVGTKVIIEIKKPH